MSDESALGQKQTFAPQKVMSALPPKADIKCVFRHVCFGPIANMAEKRRGCLREPRLPQVAARGTSALTICGNRACDCDHHFRNSPATFIRIPIVGMFHTSERANGTSAIFRIA